MLFPKIKNPFDTKLLHPELGTEWIFGWIDLWEREMSSRWQFVQGTFRGNGSREKHFPFLGGCSLGARFTFENGEYIFFRLEGKNITFTGDRTRDAVHVNKDHLNPNEPRILQEGDIVLLIAGSSSLKIKALHLPGTNTEFRAISATEDAAADDT